MNTEKLRERIRELTEQRDGFVQQANAQIAAMNGAIGELERLIELLDVEPDTAAVNSAVPSANGRKVKKELV
jgi:hypothetical protein